MTDTTPSHTLLIVYQFGKVASTSIVKSMQDVPGIEAHQSHFLGEYALKRMVSAAVDPTSNDYFHRHTVGQFMTNLDLTFKMNRVLAGHDDRRLVVLSLSREPLDWLRSSIQQDIRGYKEDIFTFAHGAGLACDDDEVMMEAALVAILRDINACLQAKGGFGTVLSTLRDADAETLFAGTPLADAAILRKIFFLAIRPIVWFDEHFKLSCGVDYREMHQEGAIRYEHRDKASYVVLRYEDLRSNLISTLDLVGIDAPEEIARENLSAEKPYAAQIRAAFASPEAAALRKWMAYTDYARQFGYDGPRHGV